MLKVNLSFLIQSDVVNRSSFFFAGYELLGKGDTTCDGKMAREHTFLLIAFIMANTGYSHVFLAAAIDAHPQKS